MGPMGQTTSRPRKTVADLMALPAETRAELIGGEIYMAPAPSLLHQETAARILVAVLGHVRERRLGRVLPAPLDVELGTGDVVQPDLVYVRTGSPITHPDRVRGAPDLVVEIVSPSNPERDRIIKRQLYERNGVQEYWVVEPELQAIEVLRLDGDAFAPAGFFTAGATLQTRMMPGLEIAIDDLFA